MKIEAKKIYQTITAFLVVAILLFTIFSNSVFSALVATDSQKVDLDYYNENFWQSHTRTTTNDKAYNGKHIQLTNSVHFYGYGDVSYKDYIYKPYEFEGEKTFQFKIDETKANYHTLDGAGIIFNAKETDGKLTADVLLFQEKQVVLYRLENVNIQEFETSPNKIVANYAKSVVATVNKTENSLHKIIIKTSPTNIAVKDNNVEIMNVNLNYSEHAGDDFGFIVSYTQHDCSILTEIEFSDFELEVEDYNVPIKVIDQFNNPVSGSTFEVLDKNGKSLGTATTNAKGEAIIKGLLPDEYTIRQISAAAGYVKSDKTSKILITDEGKIKDDQEKEIKLIEFENLKLMSIGIKTYLLNTTTPISNVKVGICDNQGKLLKATDGTDIILVTDKNGTGDFAKLANFDPGIYCYVVVEAPESYEKNTTVYSFTVKEDGSVVYNNPTKEIIYLNVKSTQTVTEEKKSLPKTGEISILTTIAVLSVIAGVSLICIQIARVKSKQ